MFRRLVILAVLLAASIASAQSIAGKKLGEYVVHPDRPNPFFPRNCLLVELHPLP